MAARREPLTAHIGRTVIKTYCRRQLARSVELSVEGRANVPATGPALLVARHVHHLLDGCILMTRLERPLHALVAVDWATPGPKRRLLDLATGLVRWPTILRDDAPHPGASGERRRRLSAAARECVALLRENRLLLMFPEGYPAIDPHPTPKTSLDDFLPFRQGFVWIAERAGDVPIIPVGFWYGESGQGWRVVVRLGEAMCLDAFPSRAAASAAVEARVRMLSEPPADANVDQPRYPRGRNPSGT